MAFPTSPSNDDLHTEFGRTYKYVSETNSWTAATTPAPENVISTVTAFESAADLPLVNNNPGDTTFVAEDNSFRLWTGNGWFEIALANTAPTITAGANASYTLNADGTPTVITMSATDPEGTPIVWGYQVTGGSLEDTSITNVGGEFTITPGTVEATFDLTFTASDGVNIDTSASSFTLSFGPDWTNTTETKVVSSDVATSDNFGYDVSISGDYAIVGAMYEDPNGIDAAGAAYIFTRSGGTWTQQAKLTASDASAGDNFGWSVDIDGDTVIVGAYAETNDIQFEGSAYIFTRSGTTWTQQAKLIASDRQVNDFAGYDVSISGDTAVFGAVQEDTGFNDAGAVYVFTRSGTTWTQQAKLQASGREANQRFGEKVEIDGDTIIVGARDDTPSTDAGAAYIFTRSGTTWTQQARLQGSDLQASDLFGLSVAIDSDTAVVGAFNNDTGGANAGAVYVFTRSGTTWTQQAKLQSSPVEAGARFGQSVAIENGTIVVGADRDSTTGLYRGSIFIFTGSGSTWTQETNIQASDASNTMYLGFRSGISGNTIITGAHGLNTGAGSAYFYTAS